MPGGGKGLSEQAVRNCVYIVDDDEALRKMIRQMLIELDADIEEFDSAEDLLSGYSERPIGCILLDLRLPGLSGLELLERISGLRPANAVIIISGFGDIPTAVKAVRQGALDFIQKPFRKDQLLAVVNRAFEQVARKAEGERELESLTPRERDVLKAFAGGSPNKIVAAELGLSPRTVEMHRARIFRKLGVKNLSQALSRVRNVRL
jgi:FixJ family two-component response regulator